MKILVLGGTGAMGTHLLNLLGNTDNEIVVTSRIKRQSSKNIKYLVGNAKDDVLLKEILQEHWDVIIDFMLYTTREFTERVKFFLDFASQYIFLSSARVYADSKEPIKETSPRLLDTSMDEEFLSTDEYSLAKARQENILKSTGKRNWTIIRPYITYSSQRLQLGVMEKESWLYRALNHRTIVFSKDINSRLTTMTYGLNVAKGIVSIIGNYDALGEIFHITSDKSLRWSDVLEIYLNGLEEYLGFRPKVMLDNINNLHTSHLAEYQTKYDRLFDRSFDNSKISKYVNIEDFLTAEEGLKKCLEEFLKRPIFKSIDWRAEALRDRKTKDFTNLVEIRGIKQKIKYLLYRLFIK
ncbi:MAG: hypothetical protein PETM_00103 [Petrimonas sp.]|jgi:nucleoside-diphosphate-sugar epimerase|uniref:NAD-dependent epimerase/dehydratase family protein n=1 Tax=Petrimonas sp. TaxID=2023866 RepID=UPI0030D5B155